MAQDFLLPQEVGKAALVASPNLDAANRPAAALATLTTLKTNLDNAIAANSAALVRTALRQASLFGIGESYPVTDDAALMAQSEIVQAEVNRRIGVATAAADPGDIAQAVLGREFLLMTPFETPFAHLPAKPTGPSRATFPWRSVAKPGL